MIVLNILPKEKAINKVVSRLTTMTAMTMKCGLPLEGSANVTYIPLAPTQ
jgi:hypothetical protein